MDDGLRLVSQMSMLRENGRGAQGPFASSVFILCITIISFLTRASYGRVFVNLLGLMAESFAVHVLLKMGTA